MSTAAIVLCRAMCFIIKRSTDETCVAH